MIFISHNSKDKPFIQPIAEKLAEVFGVENVFYDSWSIQPGDSLVGKIDNGLEKCKFFLLFVSENSMNSKMVDLEWRNALLKAVKGELKLIPIRMEPVKMPSVLTDTLFIDAAGNDINGLIRQVVDVVKGRNTYKSDVVGTGFHNLIAYWKKTDKGLTVEFQAQHYMEPISKFIILVKNEENEVNVTCVGESMFGFGFHKDLKLNDGRVSNAIAVDIDRPTVPGFPTTFLLNKKTDFEIQVIQVMKAKSRNEYISIPLLENNSL